MKMIRPVSDLRNNFAEISKTVHETAQPVFLTKNGYGDMVVLSMEAFENLQFESEIYFKLQAAEREAELSSERYSSKDVLKAMKDAIGGSRVAWTSPAEKVFFAVPADPARQVPQHYWASQHEDLRHNQKSLHPVHGRQQKSPEFQNQKLPAPRAHR